MRLRWLPEARDDLDRIDTFWAEIDPSLPPRAASAILELAQSLDVFPARGRVSFADPSSREIVGRFGSGAFILRYRVLGDEIIVVQVRHSREQP